MSKRRDIEEHVRTLDEIKGIMGAMKNLALMESHKLNRVLTMQHQVVDHVEAAGLDFLAFHPDLALDGTEEDLYLVIGSERGFCGDFNDRLLAHLDRHLRTRGRQDSAVIIVGRKLLERAERVYRIAGSIEGPTTAEEVEPVLIHVSERLRELAIRRARDGRAPVTAVFHDAVTEAILIRALRPFRTTIRETKRRPFPPGLTLPPVDFFAQLVDFYLFSFLHAIFYSSLMAESRARLGHLESAMQRLERDRTDLLRKRNILRQEEITEEIEVLMLGVEDTSRPGLSPGGAGTP